MWGSGTREQMLACTRAVESKLDQEWVGLDVIDLTHVDNTDLLSHVDKVVDPALRAEWHALNSHSNELIGGSAW